MPRIDFYDGHLTHTIESLTPEEIDGLPFGVVKLDKQGNVEIFNQVERVQSGWRKRPAIGLGFFTEIAPWMNVPSIKGRIDAAVLAGEVDLEIGHVGDFDSPEENLVIRCQSAADGGLWVFVKRP